MAEEKKSGKEPLGFLKTTALGAVLVVVPLGIIGFALWQIYSFVNWALVPVVDKLPFEGKLTGWILVVSAFVILVLFCFFTGVVVRTSWGDSLRGWAERVILERIPGYSIVRTLIHQYLGHEEERKFRPVL